MSANPYGVRHPMTLRSQTPSANVLFIVDPQNDFSDVGPGRRAAGSLAVTGSTADYARIINFLKQTDIQEVHVSLDTHSERHIAHPGFWEVWNGQQWVNATDENSKLRELFIDQNGNIAGRNMMLDNPNLDIRLYRPRNYRAQVHENLCTYVRDYINFFYQKNNMHLQKPMIWPNHCIEKSPGHRVASELQEFLQRWAKGGIDTGPATKPRILRYHNKGRNNLVEMYSAFSADKPVTQSDTQYFGNTAYDGGGYPTFEHNSTGHAQYTNCSTNVNSELNEPLIQHLLRNNNRVYFCGEARTHCVKATLLDVMKVVLANRTLYDPRSVTLLHNMSSPILPVDDHKHPDDIARIMQQNGFSVLY